MAEGDCLPEYRHDYPELQNATKTDNVVDILEPERRLSQFLYLGKEHNNYQPGYWFVHDYFLVKNVPSIEELAENEEKQLVPIDLITKAFENNLVPHPETLVFALAACCKQTKSEKLRHAAYTSIEQICASPQSFLLFVKFVTKLSREKEINYVAQGWGHGLRKAANNWYLSKEPLDFAKCVTRYRSRHGWKHKDIIKLCHPQVKDNPEREIILKYILHGMEETKAFVLAQNENSDVNKILNYIQGVEDFKHCEDEIQAAAILETYKLSLDHVPGHLLKSKEVWNSLIPSMEITTLLNNLQRINNLGFLKPDEPAVAKVTEQLTNTDRIVSEKVHPALILITIKNYENSGKPLNYEKRKVKETARKRLPPPPEPNHQVIDALYKALNASFAPIQPTNLRYLLTINTCKPMDERVWQGGHVTGIEVASLITMMVLCCGDYIDVAIFKSTGVSHVNVTRQDTFIDVLKALKKIPITPSWLSKPMSWAMNEGKKYDVFINIFDQIYERTDGSQDALIQYQIKLHRPQAKLINCALCTPSCQIEKYDKNILTINGFDATVPLVIQAFAKSLF